MANLENIILKQSLITVVAEALQSLPQVQVERVEANPQAMESKADYEILLKIHGCPLRLLVNEKKSAYPRDVLAMVRQLKSPHVRANNTPSQSMLITPALPLSSRKILREENIAYGDSSGSLYLAFEGSLFYIDKPAPRSPLRKALNIYKGKTTQVLHTLLTEPNQKWHINALASKAGVVSSTVHQVFQILEDNLWIERFGKGPELVRVLREPGALLNAWRAEYSLKQYALLAYYGWAQTPVLLRNTLTEIIEETGIEYALTLSSGAELIAPFVTSVEKLSVIVPHNLLLSSIVERAKLEPVEDGANVHFLITESKTPFLQRHRIQQTWVASDIQLYLDLWASPARGKEQADHLRKEKLSF